MNIHRLVVASALSLSSAFAGASWAADGALATAGQCEARIVRAETDFPRAAQDRGDSGTVRVTVVLDKQGRVVDSRIAESSGSQLLDRAAVKSVSTDWRFDVSRCVASALPVSQDVNVVYRRVPPSFSQSVNHRAIKYVKQAAASDQCAVAPENSGSHVVSCIERATSNGAVAPSLAQRSVSAK